MFVALLTAFLACSGTKDGSPADSGSLDSGSTDSGGGDTGMACEPGTDQTPGAPGCAAAGGVCIGGGAPCSGTVNADLSGECRFDDGAGACCVPPAAAPSGDTCASRGGTCAPIAGCGKVDGWVADSSDCTGVNNVCCVPEASCDGQEELVCCAYDESSGAPMTQFSGLCDRGTVTCFEGTALTCVEDCVVP
jgi:hypothetical protein